MRRVLLSCMSCDEDSVKNKPKRIDPNRINVRDPLILALMLGATKSGKALDRKKEASRMACRKKVTNER